MNFICLSIKFHNPDQTNLCNLVIRVVSGRRDVIVDVRLGEQSAWASYAFSKTRLFDAKGPFIYYVITFLCFLDPPRNHGFSTKNNQKLAFSDTPSPLQVIT